MIRVRSICILCCVAALAGVMAAVVPMHARAASSYVGSAACQPCHAGEYEKFQKYSKKAKSWKSVATMAPKLTPEELRGCYECHVTGYGKGGFVDYAATPQFADVGCETCHGPGAAHADSGDPSLIGKPTMATCEGCHNASRVRSFGFKPLLHSGAH
jgi:hypothetical protein